MKEFVVSNFIEFNEIIERYKKSNIWLFRGQSDSTWELIPKVGRIPFNRYDEKKLMNSWKNRAYEYIDKVPKDNWGWIILAQHYGLPTRLLDWTYNPLVASYFAVFENFDCDAVIYAIHYNDHLDQEKYDPFEVKETSIVRPQSIVARIVKQSSLFTISPNPTVSLTINSSIDAMEKITIVKSFKKEFQFKLNQLGYNEAVIFPDLDGLSRHICWHIKNMDYWDKMIND